MSDAQTTEANAQLDLLVKRTVAQLESGSLSIEDLLKALAPESAPLPEKVPEPPLPAAITDEQREALERVVEVFGSVVPDKRRELGADEIAKLEEEKRVLDTLKKMAEKRIKEGIRTAIFNHLDVKAEEAGLVDENTPREEKTGHYILEGEARGEPDTPQVFKRVVSNYSPTLDPIVLEALAEDPDFPEFTRKDYLAMTTQTRVVDEHKVMVALKKNPRLIHAIAKATRPGSKTASLRTVKA